MLRLIRPALVLLVLLAALTGLAYPFAITGVAQLAMPASANGSLVTVNGVIVGSSLIGQNFTADRFFHGRPSATQTQDPAFPDDSSKTVDAPYNAASSAASNLGPTSQTLAARVQESVDAARAAGVQGPVPADSVTTSASGLDPDISLAYALAQVDRVAQARGIDPAKLRALVQTQAEPRWMGFGGVTRVNVLRLNLAL
jgi:K+-transporting ATPase ATPase C chain